MLNQISIDGNSLQLVEKQPLIIDNLVDLVLYVQSQNGSFSNGSNGFSKYGFNDRELIRLHREHVCLYIDKYFETCIPDVQTEFLLESIGVGPEFYEGYLGRPDRDGVVRSKFWVNFCKSSDMSEYSELITPIISGGKFNPYVRFLNSKCSGQKQLNKIMDLVGIHTLDLDSGLPVLFNLGVFTFPEEIGLRLLDPKKRDVTIKLMLKCWSRMSKEFRFLFGLDPDQVIGFNVSLHLWSSEFPVIPHPHFHVVFPHFSYLNISPRYREDVELVYDHLYEELYSDIDESRRKVLKLELSNKLSDFLYFEQLPRIGRDNFPIDVDLVRFCWSEIVKEEFNICQMANLDIFFEFIKSSNKPKLLHYLQYKNRPPVLDLDLFFRKCQGFVNGYHGKDLCFDVLYNYVQSCFVSAVMSEDVSASIRYESLLVKLKKIDTISDKDLFSWLQFLVSWRTDTRVYGFWQNIKRYRITSVIRGDLKTFPVCPICGGEIQKSIGVKELFVEYLVVHDRSSFMVYEIDGG